MGTANDMKAAERTYSRFIGTVKWVVPLLAVATLLVVLIIS